MGRTFLFNQKALLTRTGAIVLGILIIATGAAADWKPTRTIQLIVPAGVGGGNDNAGRMIMRVVKENNILPVSMTVVNKPGAGGAIAYSYLNQFKGDAHYLAIYPTALLTRPITGRSDITFHQLTPIAHLLNEYSVLSVKKDSPIRDGRDLIARLKKDIHSVSFAIGSERVNTQGMALAAVMDAVGLSYKDLRALIHKSGGESYASVLGGHVDVWGSSVGNAMERVSEGAMRGIAISSPKQLGGDMAGIPTWKEQGVDIVYYGLRGFIGPGGLSKDQIAFWDKVVPKIVQSKEFQDYAAQSGAEIEYRNSKETTELLNSLEKTWTEQMNRWGLVEKKK